MKELFDSPFACFVLHIYVHIVRESEIRLGVGRRGSVASRQSHDSQKYKN